MTYLGDVVSHARHDMTTSGGVREGMALADSMFQYSYNGGVREGNITNPVGGDKAPQGRGAGPCRREGGPPDGADAGTSGDQ